MKLDMALVHAPSVYDFRTMDDVLFAYLSNSDSVHVSSIFEMPPVGIFAIEQHLQNRGFTVQFFNVASQMLRHPDFDVEEFFAAIDADYIGIDLHWLPHAHGALELTRLFKEYHPGAKALLGGIASTYYHEELIGYPQIDYVMRGFDTLLPLERLLEAGHSPEALAEVPNLTYKEEGRVRVNPMTHVPSVYTAAVDWGRVFSGDRKGMTPYNLVIPQAGCEYNCKWCGGSRYFFKKYMGLEKVSRVQKTPEMLRAELQTIAEASSGNHTVTMIDFWHEYPALFTAAEDVFVDAAIGSVHFSLHRLPKVAKGRQMGVPANAVIELSPDSHDLEVAKASGRGFYTMDEMEAFIDALIDDIHSFEIYFMLGLPKQTPENIQGTVDYCAHLLEKYQGRRVTPYICPMLPFLDPGSEIYDHAEEQGYTIFHHTVEDHRQALLSMNWKDRLNYETRWLTREQLVEVSYDAVRQLTLAKAKYGLLPRGIAKGVVALIDETRELLSEIEAFQAVDEGPARASAEEALRSRIGDYNRRQFSRVRSQQRPTDLGFAKMQWFDTDEAFERALLAPAGEFPPSR